MRILATITISLFLSAACYAQSLAYDDIKYASCDELWVERNLIYKNAGYCFKTAKAISRFGNAGCAHDSVDTVPLSRQQQRYIAEITRLERTRRCPR